MDVADFDAVERRYGFDLCLLGGAAGGRVILVADAGECGAAGGV
jgi:hypothetical protein